MFSLNISHCMYNSFILAMHCSFSNCDDVCIQIEYRYRYEAECWTTWHPLNSASVKLGTRFSNSALVKTGPPLYSNINFLTVKFF